MKTLPKILLSSILLLSTNSLFADDTKDIVFDKWVDEITKPKVVLGAGYNEGNFGISFLVNTTLGLSNDESGKTNSYLMVDLTQYRFGFAYGYDILNNKGLSGIQLIPFIGLSVDTTTSDVGYYTGIRTHAALANNFGAEIGYKYYLSKPIKDSPDTKDDKSYGFANITYQW